MVLIIYAMMLACFRCSDVESELNRTQRPQIKRMDDENAAEQICHFSIAGQVRETYFTPKSWDIYNLKNASQRLKVYKLKNGGSATR